MMNQSDILRDLSLLTSINADFFDIKSRSFSGDTHYCKNCCKNPCDFSKTHLYGCYEAQRWGDEYIYYCPNGFVFVTVVLLGELGMVEKGIVAGPVQMGNFADFEDIDDIAVLETKQVTALSNLLSSVFKANSHNASAENANEFLNSVYKVLEKGHELSKYPITLEKELQQAIVKGDSVLSKELLNNLLGHIFFHSNSDLNKIKTRVLELIVLLSRSAIEGGAQPDQIFALNSDYIKKIDDFNNLEDLSVWLGEIINRFISYVFEFSSIKHINTIYKTMAYIKENYNKKLTLEMIANNVYMSPSYLSKIFKKEMKCNVTDYINNVRIAKSKELLGDSKLSLAEVSLMVGFDDQSYFTKIFKRITGESPGKYREKNF